MHFPLCSVSVVQPAVICRLDKTVVPPLVHAVAARLGTVLCIYNSRVMVCCCVPYCKAGSGKATRVSFYQFPTNAELCSNGKRTLQRQPNHQRQVASTVVCGRNFSCKDCIPACRIRKLPDAVRTLCEGYPSYLIPIVKKPRKNPAPRASLPPQTSRKRKAEDQGSEKSWMLRLHKMFSANKQQ